MKLVFFALICSFHHIEVIETGGAFSTYGRIEKFIKYLEGKPEGKEPYERPECRWNKSIEENKI
jgi:hypothetical protein